MRAQKPLHILGKTAAILVMSSALFLSGPPVLAADRTGEIQDIADSSDYAVQAIRSLAEQGVISGDENGDFHPRSGITRAEATKILVLVLGLDTSAIPETPTFQDVPEDSWTYGYIEAAYRAGIVAGVAPGRFDPDARCTREELAKLFVSGMDLSRGAFIVGDSLNSGLATIGDYDQISAWARDAVKVAVYAGIMQGTGNAFCPGDYATKEQLAVVAGRFAQKRTEIQQELDAIANTQVTGKTNGFVFVFSEPIENFTIRSITDQDGNRKKGSLSVSFDGTYHKWINVEGEYVRANCSYSYSPQIPSDRLVPGETYRITFSYRYKYGDTKTISCEKSVTILPNSPHVESVIPLNANQLRVAFSDWIKKTDAGNAENYRVIDENGVEIPIEAASYAGSLGETQVAVLTFSKPIAKRSKLTVYVKEGIVRFTDLRPVLPYSYTVVLNDRTAPVIEQVTWGNDGTDFTSATLCFSEPVTKGTVWIDNEQAGTASGEFTTISGLSLNGSTSHQIEVREISDGVNQARWGGLYGVGRLYDAPKTDTTPPKVRKVAFTRDETGRVDSLAITYDEDLLPSVPAGGRITAFDESGNAVYAQQQVIDADGNPVAFIRLFCETPTTPLEGGTAVFSIADGVNIYSGRYTIVLPAYLVADTQYNDSTEETLTVDF